MSRVHRLLIAAAMLGASDCRRGDRAPLDDSTTPPVADNVPAPAAANKSAGGVSDSPMPGDTTVFRRGEVTFSREGKQVTIPFSSGKLITHPPDDFGVTAAVFLSYLPPMNGNGPQGGVDLDVERHQKGDLSLGDLTITRDGYWRSSGRCTATMSEMAPTGVRGSITCTEKGKQAPQGAIAFTATK